MKPERLMAVAAALVLAAPPALAQADLLSPKPLVQAPDSDELPVGDGGAPEPEPRIELPPPSSPAQIEAWRRDLVGKPVFGVGGGRIGTITELSVDLDNRVTAAVVTVPSGARLPVRWAWIETQVGRPTVLVPWSAEDIAWLQTRPR